MISETAVPHIPIRQDRDQLSAIFDSLPDGILVCELSGSIIEANEAACAILDLARHEIIGNKFGNLSVRTSPDMRPLELAWLKKAPLGSTKTFELYCDSTVRRPFWAEITLRRISLAGRCAGLVAIRDITDHKLMLNTLVQATRCDLATGLPNRRGFHEVLEHEVARYERYGGYLCVAIGSIVDFDILEQSRGLQIGDAVLAQLAEFLRRRLRKSDYMARRGREEFAFLIHDAKPDSAVRMLSRMQTGIEHYPIPEIEGPVSLRFAVTGYRLSDKPDDLLMRIDRALAASSGDRVVVG